MKPHIYKVTNLINGKVYVGQHNGSDKNYFAGGIYINRAIKKHGKHNFKREILIKGDFTTDELNDLEIKYINECKSYFHDYPDRGYNLTKGGEGSLGIVHSEETKQLLKEISPNRKSVVQLNLKGEYINTHLSIKSAAKETGILRTSILRCCQSNSCENKSAGGFGWVYEYEYKSGDYKLPKINDPSKEVKQYALNGEFVAKYNSIKEAADNVGVSATAISNMLRGITKKAAGFIWSF